MICWSCETQVPEGAAYCSECGHSQTDRNTSPIFVVDATTELFNAVFLKAIIGQEANRAVRYKRPLSVLVVEVDHADHMHLDSGAGYLSSLLRELAQALVASVRDTDTVGFLDSDGPPHFAIVLPETDNPGAVMAADKLRRSIAAYDFQAGGQWQRLTVSVGAASVTHERMGRQDLLSDAYAALQAAQAAGAGPNHTFVPAHAG